jgi:CRP/FNR family transcriptional regulator, cyclic AMP receptor protein
VTLIAALAVAPAAFDAEHVELALDVAEDEIGARHWGVQSVISCTPLCSSLCVRVVGNRQRERPMPSLIPDVATLERRLAGLPVVKHRAGEVVLTAGSKTGELLFLRSGTVEVVKDGVQIASVNAPGSVFGELAVLLDQPHTANVRTLEQSEFYVAGTPAILAGDPTVALYVAAILARRLDAANRWLVAVRRQLQTGESPSAIRKAVEKVEELLSYGGRDPAGW